MNTKLEYKIGFDRIKDKILSKCSTEYAKSRVYSEKYSFCEQEIEMRLSLTDQMRLILMFETSFPDSGFIDCASFLKPLEVEYSHIDVLSLAKLRDALETLRKILNFFQNSKEDQYLDLKKLSEDILHFPEVSRRIDSILDKYGEIKDNASDELLEIRRSIKEKEGAISRRIQSVLKKAKEDGIADDDANVSLRDGRVLIPVAVGNKRKISGFIYDESASGKTAFVEPTEVVELNNQVKELRFAEQREIIKILLEFSDFLRPYLLDVIVSMEYVGELDFIRAKAMLALSMLAGKPILSKSRELNLSKARHPLLEEALKKEGRAIVPLSLSLSNDKRILLISGPNAGGKSVCLKTVGLLQYMFQWGMLIPASESSELSIFDKIFIDIGDNQSLENDLSTYSSHLTSMKRIMQGATANSLVLIDEFGSGTEPTAGGAIAEQILSELEQRRSFGVITTHYTNLKFYANNSNGVINGAMMFDVQKIEPLFKLEVGLPGNSFAFELARKIGLPEAIVHGAEQRAGSEFVSIERHLRKIANNKRQLDQRLAKIKTTDKTLDSITEKYEKELGDIKALRKGIIEDAKKEAKQVLELANQKIEKTIREIRESQAEKEKTKRLRKELDAFTKELENKQQGEIDRKIEQKMNNIVERKRRQQQRKDDRAKREGVIIPIVEKKLESAKIVDFKLGTKVRILGNGMTGEVVQVSGKNISVAIGDIISKMSKEKVALISEGEYKSSIKPSVNKSSYSVAAVSDKRTDFKPSIDIRGKRIEEAVEQVMRFIDDAYILGMGEVSILHGKGNGVLREEIRKYLKISPEVISFKDEHIERGGTGITIVKL